MDYKFVINDFEGPLDLLLHLVKTSEMDIYDISVEKITEQYLEFIRRMEEMNLKQKDLIPYIGNKSKVSELLNRKISLSLTMVRNLSQALHIPVETLVKHI